MLSPLLQDRDLKVSVPNLHKVTLLSQNLMPMCLAPLSLLPGTARSPQGTRLSFVFFFLIFIVIQLQLYAFKSF